MALHPSLASPEGIETVLQIVKQLPNGLARISLCEEAVRTADSLNDIRVAYSAARSLSCRRCSAAVPTSPWWHSLGASRNTICDPDAYDSHELLWRYKWVVNTLPRFPQIDRASIENMLRDMEMRFRGTATRPNRSGTNAVKLPCYSATSTRRRSLRRSASGWRHQSERLRSVRN